MVAGAWKKLMILRGFEYSLDYPIDVVYEIVLPRLKTGVYHGYKNESWRR